MNRATRDTVGLRAPSASPHSPQAQPTAHRHSPQPTAPHTLSYTQMSNHTAALPRDACEA